MLDKFINYMETSPLKTSRLVPVGDDDPSDNHEQLSLENSPESSDEIKFSAASPLKTLGSTFQNFTISSPIVISDRKRKVKRSSSDSTSPVNLVNQINVSSCPVYYSSRFDNSPPIFGTNTKYNAILNAKGAGIIPYAVENGNIYFLLQHADLPCRKKENGWNDFGGKRDGLTLKDNPFIESTLEAATREFSEETSCLFYLHETLMAQPSKLAPQGETPSLKTSGLVPSGETLMAQTLKLVPGGETPSLKTSGLVPSGDTKHNKLYVDIKAGKTDSDTVNELLRIIPLSQAYFTNKIQGYERKIFIYSKEIYISYFLRVNYLPADDLPKSEDLHIPYVERYTRKCKWFTYDELMKVDPQKFHKRLQITKIKQRLKYFYDHHLFII